MAYLIGEECQIAPSDDACKFFFVQTFPFRETQTMLDRALQVAIWFHLGNTITRLWSPLRKPKSRRTCVTHGSSTRSSTNLEQCRRALASATAINKGVVLDFPSTTSATMPMEDSLTRSPNEPAALMSSNRFSKRLSAVLTARTAVAEVHIALNVTAFVLSSVAISLLIHLSRNLGRHLYAAYVSAGWLVLFNHIEILALLHRRSKQATKRSPKPGWLNVLDIATAALVAASCVLTTLEPSTCPEAPRSIDPWRLGIIGSMAFAGGLHVVFGLFIWMEDRNMIPWMAGDNTPLGHAIPSGIWKRRAIPHLVLAVKHCHNTQISSGVWGARTQRALNAVGAITPLYNLRLAVRSDE
ncbi:hypothetical protein BKA67DRAFT_681620 [Truncatella angustata]|uniref:Uncharacterized protein n=1 Tax=Truncatella angustata TaxID=152316 RepID=A0A9P8UEU0_9PEZI|nr:uncharacterized protein BKA67DRAFT_681620 [Truncatella angustata]KAH6648543.1 hypothetical protein BKA67DRAFT_681620 [Truncatella angustata]